MVPVVPCRFVCTSHSLSAATTDIPCRGCPSGSNTARGAARGESKNLRSLVAIMGFLMVRPWTSTRVSVPRPLSATDTDPSQYSVTTARPEPLLIASSAA